MASPEPGRGLRFDSRSNTTSLPGVNVLRSPPATASGAARAEEMGMAENNTSSNEYSFIGISCGRICRAPVQTRLAPRRYRRCKSGDARNVLELGESNHGDADLPANDRAHYRSSRRTHVLHRSRVVPRPCRKMQALPRIPAPDEALRCRARRDADQPGPRRGHGVAARALRRSERLMPPVHTIAAGNRTRSTDMAMLGLLAVLSGWY